MKLIAASFLLTIFSVNSLLKKNTESHFDSYTKENIVTGAEQTEKYFDYLKGKRVGILANPTTVIGKQHLVDSLMKRGINFVKVFASSMALEVKPVQV